jgi:hypothetical protein
MPQTFPQGKTISGKTIQTQRFFPTDKNRRRMAICRQLAAFIRWNFF